MKNERMLAYQLAQKLDLEEIQNVSGGIQPSKVGPTFCGGRVCDVGASWDLSDLPASLRAMAKLYLLNFKLQNYPGANHVKNPSNNRRSRERI